MGYAGLETFSKAGQPAANAESEQGRQQIVTGGMPS
jgi:hypothetical protein